MKTIKKHNRIWLFVSLLTLFCASQLPAQTSGENYVLTKNYLVATTSSATPTQSQTVQTQVTYVDGMGRPIQQVAYQQSGNGGDLITHIEYDALGRHTKNYLPHERSSSGLGFQNNAGGEAVTFYDDPYYDDTTNPYSESDLEDSPRGRLQKEAAPGGVWAMGTGKEVKYSYRLNTTNEVYLFSTTDTGNGTLPELTGVSYYDKDELQVQTTYDENNPNSIVQGSIATYTDKAGRVVLKRHYTTVSGRTIDPNSPIALDTYYLYDEYNNLVMVLPPKLIELVIVSGSLVGNHTTLVDELGYRYGYDARNRMSKKRLPGRTIEFIGYDKLDRPTQVGPVKSPFGDESLGIIVTKYDKFDRVAYTMWIPGWFGKSSMTEINEPFSVSEVRTTTNTINGVTLSYTNSVEPTSGHILTVNYYDDYDWVGAPGTIPGTIGNGDITVHYNKTTGNEPKGLPTGSWVRILEDLSTYNAKVSYTLYDQKARPVRTHVSYPSGGYTQVDSKFDFIGKVLYTKTTHRKSTSTIHPLQTVLDNFTYDAQQRLIKHTHKVNTFSEQLLAYNEYDALGRLIDKKTGGTDLTVGTYLQKVDYTYNIRGWLTDINNVNNLNDSPTDLFAFKINYHKDLVEDVNGTVERLYNGNIAETSWRTSSDNVKRHYSYSYDLLNRMLDAWYSKPESANSLTQHYDEHLTYDRNGNILTLKRNGSQEGSFALPIDDLVYNYDGHSNRLKNVQDLENNPDGFDDTNSPGTTEEYTYDEFGNLKTDEHKKIGVINYNHLNLPTEVIFDDGSMIQYLYCADGTKLKKVVMENNQSTVETGYYDEFQYSAISNAMRLDFIMHAEGAVEVTYNNFFLSLPSYNYVFHHTDHLGNIRLRYGVDPSDQTVKILEESHYYPFGLKQEGYNTGRIAFKSVETGNTINLTTVDPFLGDSFKYGFGGKERQEEIGLKWQDFEARNYDPAIGCWLVMDPITHFDFSPYSAFDNNPVIFADPSGMNANRFVPIAASGHHGFSEIGGTDFRADGIDKDGNTVQTGLSDKQVSHVVTNNNSTQSGNINTTSIGCPPNDPNCHRGSNGQIVNQMEVSVSEQDVVTPEMATMLITLTAGDGPLPFGDTAAGAIVLNILVAHAAANALVGTINAANEAIIQAADANWAFAKQEKEINRILAKNGGSPGMTYMLNVNQSGTYTDVRGNSIYLNAGEVWKYGETTQGFGRYSDTELKNMVPGGVTMNPLFFGNQVQIKVQEKIMIYGHYLSTGSLPPGNKIFR